MIPWRQCRPVAWNVTVITNLAADSYLCSNQVTAGYAAELAADRILELFFVTQQLFITACGF